MYIRPLRVEGHYILYCEGELHGKQVRMAKLVGEAPAPEPATICPAPPSLPPSPENPPSLGFLKEAPRCLVISSLGLSCGGTGRAEDTVAQGTCVVSQVS